MSSLTASQDDSIRRELTSRIERAIAYGRGLERNRDLTDAQQSAWVREQVDLAAATLDCRPELPEPTLMPASVGYWAEKNGGL